VLIENARRIGSVFALPGQCQHKIVVSNMTVPGCRDELRLVDRGYAVSRRISNRNSCDSSEKCERAAPNRVAFAVLPNSDLR
jgi:hypothetical protein